MTVRWPAEQRKGYQTISVNAEMKTADDFHHLLGFCSGDFSREFCKIVKWLIQEECNLAELELRMSEVCDQMELQNVPDGMSLLITWACATALHQSPSLETWEKIRDLKSDSWKLEHWLPEAMIVKSIESQKPYIELARKAFKALDDFTLLSKFDRTNQERKAALKYWNENSHRLDKIWWGLREWHGLMNYGEEFLLFRVLHELDPSEFIHLIGQSENPYFVHSLLFAVGVNSFSGSFSQWEKFIVEAPLAFDPDGTWNGSPLAPLLLVEAFEQLLCLRKNLSALDVSGTAIEQAKQETKNVVKVIVDAIFNRQDAKSLSARWATWLMRKFIGHSQRDVANVRYEAFFAEILIDEIGSRLKDQSITIMNPNDAAAWEAWCYRCVLSSHINAGFVESPDCEDFLREWIISPDDWVGEKGQALRDRASLMTSLSKENPDLASHALAVPIARLTSPTDAWKHMWNDSQTLREVVEFGHTTIPYSEHYYRLEAEKLLLLVFGIGVAIFDHRINQCLTSNSAIARSQAALYELLASAVKEMLEIGNGFISERWQIARIHLAIRRFIWEEKTSLNQEEREFVVFRSDDCPTFESYLEEVKNDPIEVINILLAALLNNLNITFLKEKLIKASIEITEILSSVRRLNGLSPHRYPLDEKQLQKLEILK